MSKLLLTPLAKQDLHDIKEYISGKLHSPVAAMNTVAQITKRLRLLEGFPHMGPLLSSIHDGVDTGDTRFLVCENYLAFYRTDETIVYIDRIMYGRRDYISILFGELPSM